MKKKKLALLQVSSCSLLLLLCLFACKRYNPASDKIYEVPAYNNLEKATSLQIIDDAIENNPEIAENHYKKAKLMRLKGQDSLAMKSLQNALQIDSLNGKYNYLKAEIAYDLGQAEVATQALLLGQQVEKDYLEGYLLGGQLYYEAKEYEQAIKQLNQALEITQKEARVYYLKGRVALARYDSTNALRNFRRALRQKPQYFEVYRSLAELYYLYEKYLTATRYVDKGLKIAPKNDQLNLVKARIYRARRYYKDSAKVYYEKAYQLNKNLYEAAYHLGKYYFDEGKSKTARPYFAQALRSKADFGEAHYYLGLCQKYAGEDEEALESFSQAIKHSPKNLAARDQYWAVKNKIEQRKLLAREDSIRRAYYERLRKLQEEQNKATE